MNKNIYKAMIIGTVTAFLLVTFTTLDDISDNNFFVEYGMVFVSAIVYGFIYYKYIRNKKEQS